MPVDLRPEPFPLPDAELVIGISRSGYHAVTRTNARAAIEALAAIGAAVRIRDAVPWAVCGERVRIASKWGPYERNSEHLAYRRRCCVNCAWMVAVGRDEVAAEIAAHTPDAGDQEVIGAAVGDPLLGVHLLEAVGIDLDLQRGPCGDIGPSELAAVFAHASRHLPAVLVCEECLEGPSHDGARCPSEFVACMQCTATAGPRAGELQGTVLPSCTVAAPCSVLTTLCTHYGITVAARGGQPDMTFSSVLTAGAERCGFTPQPYWSELDDTGPPTAGSVEGMR